nr:NAD(P)H-dependent oxidoreductase [Streptomyces sp. WAC04770]
MTKVAVIYYSSQGNVHKLAVAAAAAAEKAGAEVRLRRTAELSTETVVPGNDAWNKAWAEHLEAVQDIPEAAIEDLEWADAVLWGTPGRYGLPARPGRARAAAGPLPLARRAPHGRPCPSSRRHRGERPARHPPTHAAPAAVGGPFPGRPDPQGTGRPLPADERR